MEFTESRSRYSTSLSGHCLSLQLLESLLGGHCLVQRGGMGSLIEADLALVGV